MGVRLAFYRRENESGRRPKIGRICEAPMVCSPMGMGGIGSEIMGMVDLAGF